MCIQLRKTKPTRVFILELAKQYRQDERGATAIEYGLITALISLLLISGASALGGSLSETYFKIAELLLGPPDRPPSNIKSG
ncbi:MAG: Flp family type IVb pilin [Litorimonas sp.]